MSRAQAAADVHSCPLSNRAHTTLSRSHSVVDAIKLLAAEKKAGRTVRRVILEALKAYGVTVPDTELCDRRK